MCVDVCVTVCVCMLVAAVCACVRCTAICWCAGLEHVFDGAWCVRRCTVPAVISMGTWLDGGGGGGGK